MTAIPVPIEVEINPGEIHELNWPEGVPTAGQPIIADPGFQDTWDGLWKWASQKLFADVDWMQSKLTLATAQVMIQAALKHQQQAFASVVSNLKLYFQQTVISLASTQLGLSQAILGLVIDTLNRVDALGAEEWWTRNVDLPALWGSLQGLQAQIDTIPRIDPQTLLQQVYDTQVAPLWENLGQETATRDAQTSWIANNLVPTEIAGVLAQIAPVATVAAAAQASARAIQTWQDECGQPMCDTMGPKTDLGKLLKMIQAGALLAMLAELAGADFEDVENVITTVARTVGGVIGQAEELFVEGGETLGGTLARLAAGV